MKEEKEELEYGLIDTPPYKAVLLEEAVDVKKEEKVFNGSIEKDKKAIKRYKKLLQEIRKKKSI